MLKGLDGKYTLAQSDGASQPSQNLRQSLSSGFFCGASSTFTRIKRNKEVSFNGR